MPEQTASRRALDDVDKVAEAIWRADSFRMGDPDTWTGDGDQLAYRTMALAAINTLGITEEWRTTGWLGPVAESLARKQAETKGTLQRRVVGPWTPAT